MFSVKRMYEVTRKETKELIRNKMGFMLSIIAPVVLYFLFSFGMPLEVKDIPMAILDEDNTPESRLLADSLKKSRTFSLVQQVKSYAEMENIMRLGNIRACFVIPQGFAKKIKRSEPQTILALIEATYPGRAQMSGGYGEAVVQEFNSRVMADFLKKYAGAEAGGTVPVNLYISPWFNPTLRSEDYIVPGVIGVILVFLPPIIAAISVAKEKETGSIINMFVSPIGKAEYLLGKMIPYIVITYFNFILFFIFTVTIFKVPLRGDPVLLFAVSLLYSIDVIGIGLLVSVLVSNQISAILVSAVLNLIPAFMYSGFFIPLICLDDSAKQTAYSLITTYYIDFIRKLMIKGLGPDYLMGSITAMLIYGFAVYGLSIILFKKKLG
ncbi:MAG: ABC transporter permease [Firmicutes bacterium]|nr:ABC transporter permease [Bacillota bacterium]